MDKINIGDKIKVKDRPDWPSPPGYKLAGAEGLVTRIWEPDGPEALQNFVEVRILKTNSNIDISYPYNFHKNYLEKT